MTRPVGGAGKGKMPASPSAQEMYGMMGAPYGFNAKETQGMARLMGGSQDTFANPFKGLPTASSKGEFFEAISFITDPNTMNYYKPQSYESAMDRNQAGEAPWRGGELLDRSRGMWSEDNLYYDTDYDTGRIIIPGQKGPQMEESDAPADISVIPTSSKNPQRPRTVAAGYDRSRETLTVIFRDGTFYNYYEVSSSEWLDFKARISKGEYIYKYLDFHPRGPANTAKVPSYARAALYRLARAGQLQSQGKQGTSRTKKPPKPKK
ncbi:MAG: KTSC domain-containing protein [Actinobacteria bacterium]|nr:KTSC domain-containing protein [Actinomycetota bacterium]